jgi:hypothetical protein
MSEPSHHSDGDRILCTFDRGFDIGFSLAANEAVRTMWAFPEHARGLAVVLADTRLFHDGLAPAGTDHELIELLLAAYDACEVRYV